MAIMVSKDFKGLHIHALTLYVVPRHASVTLNTVLIIVNCFKISAAAAGIFGDPRSWLDLCIVG